MITVDGSVYLIEPNEAIPDRTIPFKEWETTTKCQVCRKAVTVIDLSLARGGHKQVHEDCCCCYSCCPIRKDLRNFGNVDARDILPNQENVRMGKRQTCYTCSVCKDPLLVEHLSDILKANAPRIHFRCYSI